MSHTHPRIASGVLTLGCILAVVGVFLPWFQGGITGHHYARSGYSPWLWFFTGPVLLLTIIAMVGGAVYLINGHPPKIFLPILTAIAGAWVLFYVFLVEVLATVSGTLLGGFLVISAIRRYAFHVIAGSGAWLALSGLAIATLIAMPWPASVWKLDFSATSTYARLRLGAIGVMLIACIGLAWVRYTTWIDLTALNNHTGVPGWAIPWVGPWSLFPVFLIAIGIGVSVFSLSPAGPLIAAFGGWVITFLTGFPTLLATIASMHAILQFLPAEFHGNTGVAIGPGIWLAYGAGLMAAAGGSLALWASRHETVGRA